MNKLVPILAIGTLISVALLFVVSVESEANVATYIIIKIIALALGILTVITSFIKPKTIDTSAPAKKPVEEASKPTPTVETKGSAEVEVITLLARMQEKGRFIDFLMEDISGHDDKTVGSVARLVYQGCREVMDEHFTVKPVESGKEGDKVSIPEGYDAGLYRLTGNLSGDAPFKGTLVHKGWKVTSAKLPKVITADSDDLPALAPAQVEV